MLPNPGRYCCISYLFINDYLTDLDIGGRRIGSARGTNADGVREAKVNAEITLTTIRRHNGKKIN